MTKRQRVKAEQAVVRGHPILFSSPMVRAILEGRKTQTRRALRGTKRYDAVEPHEGYPGEWQPWEGGEKHASVVCPYGVPGNRLWVRETWAQVYDAGKGSVTVLPPSGEATRLALRKAIYRATSTVPDNAALVWKPSIHMPRWASRLTLEIVDVRVERLQDISEQDAKAEGVEQKRYMTNPFRRGALHARFSGELSTYGEAYALLWDSLNAKRGHGWGENPWVWVIEFARLAKMRGKK